MHSASLPDVRSLALHCDRCARRTNSTRTAVAVLDVPRGWARLRPGGESDEFASTGFNRVHWFTLESPITPTELDETLSLVRSAGARRVYLWMSAAGCAGAASEALERVGAARVPYVRYVVLARRAEVVPVPPTASLSIRPLSSDELPGVLASLGDRFTAESAKTACELVERGIAETYGAFEGDRPAAFAALIPDHEAPGFGHLGWAGTLEEFRNRGAQSALIASRVSRSAESGLAWCVSETNTAVPTSLKNLARAGFAPMIEWHVYRWDVSQRGT